LKVYEFEIGGKSYQVEVEAEPGHVFKVKVDGKELQVELKSVHYDQAAPASETPLVVRQQISAGSEIAGLLTIRAPIPGEVKKVAVKLGEVIGEGDMVVVIEAMKMENNIVSSAAGKVKEILVKEGQNVKLNQALVSLEVIRK
jgi:biotin carboxyl carrier protein